MEMGTILFVLNRRVQKCVILQPREIHPRDHDAIFRRKGWTSVLNAQ
jgi:hypothetical protein